MEVCLFTCMVINFPPFLLLCVSLCALVSEFDSSVHSILKVKIFNKMLLFQQISCLCLNMTDTFGTDYIL